MTDPSPSPPSAAPSGAPSAGAPRSPKLGLLGCGCGVLVLGLMLLFLGFTFLAYRQSKRIQAGYENPAEAEVQVDEVLPHDELPPGYYPLGGASVPVFFRLAILTDLPPSERSKAGGAQGADRGEASATSGTGEETTDGPTPRRFRRSGFVFFSTFSLRTDDSELVRYFEHGPEPGKKEMELKLPDDSIAGDLGMDFTPREVVRRGSIPVRGGEVYYVARRGRLEVGGEPFQGLATLFYVKCGTSHRIRFGLWFTPEPPARAAAPDAARYLGTPADPQALADFLAYFWICR